MLLTAGDLVLDVLVRSDTGPHPGSEGDGQIVLAPGGSAANVARWAAHLGFPARFVGSVGDDFAGRWLTEAMRSSGVDVRVDAVAGEPTGVVAVWVDPSGERTMVTDRTANRYLPPRLLDEDTWSDVTHFHFTGYSLLASQTRERILAAKAIAVRRGCTLSFDPGPHRRLVQHVGAAAILAACDGVDVLLPNEAEAVALAAAKSVEEAIDRLSARSSIVCIKRGSAGCLLARGAQRLSIVPPGHTAVDTTGAGDAFAAGFLAVWKRGASVPEAAAAGVRAAARAVSHVGAGPQGWA
ncbi:MAG: sugar kinase [Armatimonadota bacterium]|nr:sugar kinase [Armatimonadota bacterium]MDR5697020.1 sugar kinase [Armatimonadota bacterium]